MVAERRCARKGNMFQKAARLDFRTGGLTFARGLPFLRILTKEQDHAATTSRAELLEAEAAKIKQERKKR